MVNRIFSRGIVGIKGTMPWQDAARATTDHKPQNQSEPALNNERTGQRSSYGRGPQPTNG